MPHHGRLRCPATNVVAPANAIKPTAGRIPMREGLIVTTTYGRRLSDVEERMTTSSIEPGTVTITNNGLYFADDDDPKGRISSSIRVLCAADMKRAYGYAHGSWAHSPSVSPGVTSEVLSAAAFQQLKETGKLTLRYMTYIQTNEDGYYKHWQLGELSRVELDDIPYPVIVNDSITTLPAIHVRGLLTAQGKGANKASKYAIDRPTMLDLKVSDDPLNPIVLFFKFEDDPFRIEVTKIQFPNQEKRMEQALAKETDLDFLFPSVRLRGSRPLSPDSILEKSIRPALAKIGVVGKQIGWHSFRHSLATNLRSLGVDIKVAQELMRYSSCRTTLDVYTRAVDQQKREASVKIVELMLPLDMEKFRHPSAPSAQLKAVG